MKNNDYEPSYNYYIKNNQIILIMECPGNIPYIKSNIFISGKYNIIEIKGTKKKDEEPDKIEDNLYNNREFGNFCIKIPLIIEEIKLKNEKPQIFDKKGIYTFKYDLEENNKIFGENFYVDDI